LKILADNILFEINGFEFVLYQNLSESDSKLVLECRNHPDVRKWMFNSDKILHDDHKAFVESLKSTSQKVYCAVFKKSKLIGCIYYNVLVEGVFYAGHFLNPRIISTGIGLYFEYVYLHYFFHFLGAKEIQAQVKSGNKSMVDIHKLCGFHEKKVLGNSIIDYSFTRDKFLSMPTEINDFVRILIKNYKKDEC